jgi:hypothetical protein
MRSLALAVVMSLGVAASISVAASAGAAPGGPFNYNALGPMRDVTAHWQRYQPAAVFCVRPETPEYTPGGIGPTVTGSDPVCRNSGFPRSAKGLVVIRVHTPTLCPGCRRLFIDFSAIPRRSSAPDYYPRGHIFYRFLSFNPTYTIDPIAHSPNTKNFTNDKLISPAGSPQEQVVGATDLHQATGYAGDTLNFVHTRIQGPYYIGPWYINRAGQRIEGVYFDVDAADATQLPGGRPANDIRYVGGFNSGNVCPGDQDSFYGGCVNWWAYSTSAVNPFEPLR